MKMSKYINLEKQLVRLYRLGLDNEEVIKQFLLTACEEDVVEVRHGYWVNDNHLIKCSICGSPIPLNKVVLHGEVIWEDNRPVNYCPNCGAKMDKVSE